MIPSPLSVMQGFRDSCQQQLSVKRLPEKSANALSAALVRDLVASGNKKHRQVGARAARLIAKLEAIDIG